MNGEDILRYRPTAQSSESHRYFIVVITEISHWVCGALIRSFRSRYHNAMKFVVSPPGSSRLGSQPNLSNVLGFLSHLHECAEWAATGCTDIIQRTPGDPQLVSHICAEMSQGDDTQTRDHTCKTPAMKIGQHSRVRCRSRFY